VAIIVGVFALLSYQRRDRALRVEVATPNGEDFLAQVKHALPHAECLNLWRLLVVRNRAVALGAEDPDYDRCAALQSFFFSCASLAAMKARISADMSSSFSHCSLYNVTGKRPIP
jgi:hypothetical protein